MGRRALAKIDPALDLSRHLKSFDELPQPWSPAALFGREAPLEVEIGSGKGLFLLNAAAARPEIDFLGSEISGKYARYCAARLAKRGLDNACMLHGDAQRLLAEVLPTASASAVHVYFPDPWWKKRHKKRRVINPTLVGHVQRILKPEGRLHLWTDVQEYFESSLEIIAEHTTLGDPLPVAESPAADDFDYRTNFERRKRMIGAEIYRAQFVRPGKSALKRLGLGEEL